MATRDCSQKVGLFVPRRVTRLLTQPFQVYTRVAPKPTQVPTPAAPQELPTTSNETSRAKPSTLPPAHSIQTPVELPASSDKTQAPPVSAAAPVQDKSSVVLPPLNTTKTDPSPISPSGPPTVSNRSSSIVGISPYSSSLGPDSKVLNDTLNVIDEHITDMRTSPGHSAQHPSVTDSGSEYSAPLDSRMSYIQGDETDEEEGITHTREEVVGWSPDAVAEFLFTTGVEKQHCEVFRDQEISGEVLLGMDQSSLFIKAFDLGSVGRRLKTWHRIKALQDEVAGIPRRNTQTYGSDAGSEDAGRTRTRTNTLTHRPLSTQSKRLSASHTSLASPIGASGPLSPTRLQDSPTRPSHTKRPSAASIREMHHSRRHSSTDYSRHGPPSAGGPTPHLLSNKSFPDEGAHRKQPSFDRNWNLGNAFSQSPSRPLSSTGLQDILTSSDQDLQDSAVDLDRGYFSGTEADGRKRNVLRKRDSQHSRKSSYAEEQRVRSATALSRHSRFGSMDSYRDSTVSPAAQKYFGVQQSVHRRTTSANTTESYRPPPPAKDGPPPTVTRLDGPGPTIPIRTPGSATTASSDWLSSVINKPAPKVTGLRAISDNLGTHKTPISSPVDSLSKDRPLPSPAHTGSSTPSGGPSLDLESPDAAKFSGAGSGSRQARKKGKKETSAYTRGLQKIKPADAIAEADYSGWMRKKSSNLMTTWKPRLFVLKGRRLAYYYSDDDDQERGLIDISFHRVLPADNEKLTGLHATITGAVPLPGGGPKMEKGEKGEKGDDSMFIFKLVPPRAGLSRAVNFTKPTVHYFSVPNLKEGRLWMAALMKATIDRDDAQPVTTTYQQKTISLAKAKQMRHRPPALMNLEEAHDEDAQAENGTNGKPSGGPEKGSGNGLGIYGETDSGVSGMDKLAGQKIESATLNVDFGVGQDGTATPPQSA